MNKFNLIIGIVAIIAIVLSIVALNVVEREKFGSTHFTGPIYSNEGYYVDTTEVFDTSGNLVSGGAMVGTSLTSSGAVSGTTLTCSDEANLDTLVQGGDVTTINTASTSPTAAQWCNSAIIKYDLSPGDLVDTQLQQDVVYFASSSNMIADCIPAIGDSKKTLIWNYSTTTYTVRFAELSQSADKLDLLFTASTTYSGASSINDFQIDAGEYMWVTYLNLDGTTSTVSVIQLSERP